jgi:hypothetical protein
MRNAMAEYGITLDDVADAWDRSGGKAAGFRNQLAYLPQLLGLSEQGARDVAGEFGDVGRVLQHATTAYDQMSESGALADETMDGTAGAAEGAAGEFDELTGALGTAGEEARDFARQWRDLVEGLLGGVQAQVRAEQLVDDVTAALTDLDDKDLTQVKQEVLDFIAEMAEIEGAAAEAGEDVSGFTDAATYGLLLLMQQAGFTEAEVAELLRAIQAIDGAQARATVTVDYVYNGSPEAFLAGNSQFSVGAAAPSSGPATYGGKTAAEWESIGSTNVYLDGVLVSSGISEAQARTGVR